MSYTVGMQTTNYVWDVAARLPVVLQDGENAYVYGLDLISATDDEGDQTYFLYDGLGSVTDVTDANGNVLASYSYDVFGAIRSQTGTSENYWLFTGEQTTPTAASTTCGRSCRRRERKRRCLGEDAVPAGKMRGCSRCDAGEPGASTTCPFGLALWTSP